MRIYIHTYVRTYTLLSHYLSLLHHLIPLTFVTSSTVSASSFIFMSNIESFEDFSASNDQAIVKRKRSKRLRPLSSSSSTSYGACGDQLSRNSLVSSSPASSSTCTDEDEDMANCLILLARGDAGFSLAAGGRFRALEFTETADNGKVGGGYECKTCGRSFSSFQALGGHRASHKKPKLPPAPVPVEVDQKKSPSSAPPPQPPQQQQIKEKLAITTPPISTKLFENMKSKTHECSLCGSEFGSGQALGGHMRRHRPVTTPAKNDPLSPADVIGVKTTGNVLALDLNLPAPPEEDRRHDDEFDDQFSSNQQPPLVFSTAGLLDCHY